MLDSIFNLAEGLTLAQILICTAVSLGLGLLISLAYMWRAIFSRNLAVTIILMPAIVQSVILIVNGNLGTGIAVMGAFSLVRFRSVPGSSREIAYIFFAMAVGLATGMGYLVYAAVFTVLIIIVMLLLTIVRYGEQSKLKSLKITVPEDVDYENTFKDLISQYTAKAELSQIKTTNLGSLFELHYSVVMKPGAHEKDFIDGLRCRNGNLNIVFNRAPGGKDEL